MKNRINIKNWLPPLTAFISVGIMCILFYALLGFYPFGERSVAWCDMEQQYVPLLMELRRTILENGSVFLGKGGGGMNFWGVFMFFVSSPLVLLSVMVKEENIIYFINVLTMLKMSLCGASAQIYFQKVFPKLPRGFGVLFSVIYAFNGCVMMYYQNNMWLEMMILFPLLLLSMFRLCEKGKWGSFVLCLSAAMYLNFYISFMYVIFILISSGLMLFIICRSRKRSDRALKFTASYICTALITAFVWIPSFFQFTSSGRSSSSNSLFLNGTLFRNAYDKLALIACTPIVFAVFVLIFTERKNIKNDKKAVYFSIITIILTIGALIDPINKVWHTGSYQAFPFRYGFMLVLAALSVCAGIVSNRKNEKIISDKSARKKRVSHLILVSLFIVFNSIVIVFSEKFNSYVRTLWLSYKDAMVLIAVGLFGGLFYFVCIRNYCYGDLKKRFSIAVLSIAVIFGSFMSFNIYFGNTVDVSERFSTTVALNDKIDDDNFYRVKTMKRYFYSNMAEGMGMSSLGHYTSLTDKDFLFSAKKLGYSSYWMDSSSNGGTVITDAFLMNKYFIGSASDMNGLSERYYNEGLLKIYRNILSGDGAVISDVSPQELTDYNNCQRIEATSYIAKTLYNEDNIIAEIFPNIYENITFSKDDKESNIIITDTSKKGEIKYSFFVDGRKEIYFDIFNNYSTSLNEPYFNSVDIYVNGKCIAENYPDKPSNGIIDLGTFEDNYVSVSIFVKKNFSVRSFGLYSLDINKAVAGVKNTPTAHIELNGNKIYINADSDSGGYVYIPFAFSKGFSAELNGKKTDISKVLGSFMAVGLEKGENNLVLTFYPPGFKVGVVLSIIGIITFVLLIMLKVDTRKYVKSGTAIKNLLFTASIVMIVLLYVMIPIIWILFK